MNTLTALIILVVLIAGLAVLLYNGLIKKRNEVKESFAGIEVQLKRRYDLIPNLVNTVQGYMKHEAKTLQKVTEARTTAMQAGTVQDKAQAENMLSSTLKSLFAVAENYPDLKANQNFLQLQSELSDTEDKLSGARRFYNNCVKSLNTAIETVPTNIIANMFNFKKEEFFELEEAEKQAAKKAPEVKFD